MIIYLMIIVKVTNHNTKNCKLLIIAPVQISVDIISVDGN